MMAMFFANRIILGKTAFSALPKTLKDPVYKILVDCEMEELAEGYQPKSA